MKVYISILLSIFLFSCNSSNNNEMVEREAQRKKEENAKIIQEKLLTEQYNIKYDWDTLDYEYSILYEKVISTQFQLISNPKIEDIYKEGQSYNIRIQCGYLPIYLILKTHNTNLVDTILSEIQKGKYFYDFLFVAEVEQIKKGLYQLYAIPEYDDEAYIELDPSVTYFGKGNLIDVKILKK